MKLWRQAAELLLDEWGVKEQSAISAPAVHEPQNRPSQSDATRQAPATVEGQNSCQDALANLANYSMIKYDTEGAAIIVHWNLA